MGHTWHASVKSRTRAGTGCPYCSGNRVLAGFNDLATTHPEAAGEADGWDPSTVTKGAKQKLPWKCSIGHTWQATPNNRTNAWHAQGCPYCANKSVWQGFNDLATTHPEVASEASGWDPRTVVAGSHKKLKWECPLGHLWETAVLIRTIQGSGCPVCAGKTVLEGFNDLA